MKLTILLFALLAGCLTGTNGDPGGDPTVDPDDPADPTTPGDPPSPPSPPFGAGEPRLIDSDGDGAIDAIDLEPDGDGDYLFDTAACGEPRLDRDGDGHVDAIDIDCNGQIDLLVAANRTVSPAPGANCFVGSPGQGAGHGPGGYGCD